MNIEIIPVGPFEVNCILLWRTPEKAILVDAGSDAKEIEARIAELGLTLEAQLLTHGHMDHLSAAAAIQRNHPAPVHLHAADARWAFTPANTMMPFYPQPERPANLLTALSEGQTLDLDVGPVQILETPGHSPGSVCFLLQEADLIIAGDTLFSGSVGRTDLPGGDANIQAATLRRLDTLSPELRVLCGHGPDTSMGQEQRTNPYMQNARERAR